MANATQLRSYANSDPGFGVIGTTAGLSKIEGSPNLRQEVITLTSVAITMTDNGTTGSGSVKLMDFGGQGQFTVLGTTANLTYAYSSATDANAISSVGTATINADGDLGDTGEGNLIASTATAIATSAGTFKAVSTAAAFIDGTAATPSVYLNIATSSDPGASAVLTATGTITITYTWTGDK